MPGDNTILLIDDNAINRKILAHILSPEYDTVEAENGIDALNILNSGTYHISGIILDLVMPKMNGFEFLDIVSKAEKFKNIPVIISTANDDEKNEIHALKLSAWDFVAKPYNPKIIKYRLKNAIERSQLSAFEQLKYMAEYDTLTGIYNRVRFNSAVHDMLMANSLKKFAMIHFDINRFKLINSFYGNDEGDKLLKWIGTKLKETFSDTELSVFGRIEGDVFAVCTLYRSRKSINSEIESLTYKIKSFATAFDIVLTYGIYVIEDNFELVDTFLDKASLASKSIKGDYVRFYEYYTPSMSLEIEKEQLITNAMSDALKNGQFVLYFQPKYNLLSNSPSGAEVLVRWKDPVKGIIPPSEFIPVFERNGFISKLDQYVWESACQYLRKWLDSGINPMPLSVNISRVDVYNPNLAKIIYDIVQKYNIPTSLFHLELTESAYTDNPQSIKLMLKELHSYGFLVMMDDFGSGYSSLNILKELPVDVLKIDLRFLSGEEIAGRGETIVAAIIRMAKLLKIPAIAEGVETKEQADFLLQIGCEFVQGYYFSRPISDTDYEKLLASVNNSQESRLYSTFDSRMIVNNAHIEKILCDSFQPICIFEYDGSNIDLLRVNSSFHKEFGFGDIQVYGNIIKNVKKEQIKSLLGFFDSVVKNRKCAEFKFSIANLRGDDIPIRMKLFYLHQSNTKHILLGLLSNITYMNEITEEIQKYKNELKKP